MQNANTFLKPPESAGACRVHNQTTSRGAGCASSCRVHTMHSAFTQPLDSRTPTGSLHSALTPLQGPQPLLSRRVRRQPRQRLPIHPSRRLLPQRRAVVPGRAWAAVVVQKGRADECGKGGGGEAAQAGGRGCFADASDHLTRSTVHTTTTQRSAHTDAITQAITQARARYRGHRERIRVCRVECAMALLLQLAIVQPVLIYSPCYVTDMLCFITSPSTSSNVTI